MDITGLLVVMATVGTLAFSWANFLMSRKKVEDEEFERMEQRILELMGRFKHVSSMRIEMLDKKINEIKRVMREANDIYSSLVVKMTDLMKLKEEVFVEEKQEEVIPTPEDLTPKEEEKEEAIENEDMGIEKRIVSMYDEGLSDIEIARKLGIGVGEVRLMISLFRKRG